jgi:hypothetical protein
MPKKSDLMGLGMPVFLAQRMATEPSQVTAQGATFASAKQVAGDQYLISVTGSNTGMALKLPYVGGDGIGYGALLGDDFIINALYGTCSVYAGSGVTISIAGANYASATGVTVEAHTATTFYPITATQWLGVKGS